MFYNLMYHVSMIYNLFLIISDISRNLLYDYITIVLQETQLKERSQSTSFDSFLFYLNILGASARATKTLNENLVIY